MEGARGMVGWAGLGWAGLGWKAGMEGWRMRRRRRRGVRSRGVVGSWNCGIVESDVHASVIKYLSQTAGQGQHGGRP
jgi:hypothetical protein